MTIIIEKQGTYRSFVDDLVPALLAFPNWTDADSDVTNTGDTDEFVDNGRVLQNSDTGTFVAFSYGKTMYPGSNTDGWRDGIQITHCTDWDTDEHQPRGYQNQYSGSSAFDVSLENVESFDFWDTREHEYACCTGLAAHNNDQNDTAERKINYFGSARQNGFNMAAWSDKDQNNGIAGFYSFEHIENKLWDDNEVPVAILARESRYGLSVNEYGFRQHAEKRSNGPLLTTGRRGIEDGAFGIVNPDANDDTFFYRKPAIFNDPDQRYPVGYVEGVAPNEINEGAAHGDEVNIDGKTYRIFRQSGAMTGNTITAGLLYE
jgi:hypothetical protein